MKNIYTIAAITLFALATPSCNNYRNTSIFETIPESELISKCGKDYLFLSIYEDVNENRETLAALRLDQKAKFHSITYNDLMAIKTDRYDSISYNKHRNQWETLYKADELACDSLLLHYKHITTFDNLTANEALKWYCTWQVIEKRDVTIYNRDNLLVEALAPKSVKEYWNCYGLYGRDRIIRELVNPSYVYYSDYFIQQEYPLVFELMETMRTHYFKGNVVKNSW